MTRDVAERREMTRGCRGGDDRRNETFSRGINRAIDRADRTNDNSSRNAGRKIIPTAPGKNNLIATRANPRGTSARSDCAESAELEARVSRKICLLGEGINSANTACFRGAFLRASRRLAHAACNAARCCTARDRSLASSEIRTSRITQS